MWIFSVTIVLCALCIVSSSRKIPPAVVAFLLGGGSWLDHEDYNPEHKVKEMSNDTDVFQNYDTFKWQDDTHFTRKPLIRKCCPKGEGFDISKDECRAVPNLFNHSKEFNVLFSEKVSCSTSLQEVKKLATSITQNFYLQSNGTLRVMGYGTPKLVYNISKYCIDWFINSENKTQYDAFVCHIQFDYERHFILTGACMLTTCLLVLLRLFVYAWLPELRNLHGMILMAYLISFLVGFMLLGSKMLLMYEQKINPDTCVTITFVVYFSILSAFFWRNVMCYDIWWTFSGKRAMSGKGSASRTRLYCTYALGGPTGFTMLLAALEYSGFSGEHMLMPKVREYGCYSLFGYSKLLYFYGPITTLFVINMILFTLTALKIAAIKKETSMVFESEQSKIHDQNEAQRFMIYAKLFAAMMFLEINWIIEIFTIFYPDDKIVLDITELYNVVMFLGFFINFLCHKKTWSIIRKRYQQTKSLPKPVPMTFVLTSSSLETQSRDTVTSDNNQEEASPLNSQDSTKSTDHKREDMSPAYSQYNNPSTDNCRGETNPAYTSEEANSSNSQKSTKSSHHKREDMTSHAYSQNVTPSTDNSRGETNPAYTPEEANSSNSLKSTKSSHHKREDMTSHAYSQDDTPPTDNSRGETNPAYTPSWLFKVFATLNSQDGTKSTDYRREHANSSNSQHVTKSTDYIREEANSSNSQDSTKSTDHRREDMNPVYSQDDAQSTDDSSEVVMSQNLAPHLLCTRL